VNMLLKNTGASSLVATKELRLKGKKRSSTQHGQQTVHAYIESQILSTKNMEAQRPTSDVSEQSVEVLERKITRQTTKPLEATARGATLHMLRHNTYKHFRRGSEETDSKQSKVTWTKAINQNQLHS
jgi:hypothetical protein